MAVSMQKKCFVKYLNSRAYVNSMTACAILALIALVTGPNSTQLYLMQFSQLLLLL